MTDFLRKHVYTYRGETFPHRIKVETHNFHELNEWTDKNTKGSWSDKNTNRGYFIEFELEEDAVAFKLRWT